PPLLLLPPLALGDVLEYDDAPLQTVMGAEWRGRVGHRQLAATARHEPLVLDANRLLLAQGASDGRLLEGPHGAVRSPRVDDAADQLSAELSLGPAEQVL